MATLSERIQRRKPPSKKAEEFMAGVFADRLALAGAKELLKRALPHLKEGPLGEPDAQGAAVAANIERFLERHP